MTDRTKKLKDFYNLQNQNAPLADEKQILDMSSSKFNSHAYFSHLKDKRTLNELMDIEALLARETRKYDTDMQNLVMENYNKFILATDTIGKLKTDFHEMEDKVIQVSKNIKQANQQAKCIGKDLAPNRQKLQKLLQSQKDLSQLQFIFSLPTNLQNSLEKEDFEKAVSMYMKAKTVLNKYRNHPSFEKTSIHVDILIGKIQAQIYSKYVQKVTKNFEVIDESEQSEIIKGITWYLTLKPNSDHIFSLLKKKFQPDLPFDLEKLPGLLDNFEKTCKVLSMIETLEKTEMKDFAEDFFNELRVCIDSVSGTDISVHQLRSVYQRLLEAGDSPFFTSCS